MTHQLLTMTCEPTECEANDQMEQGGRLTSGNEVPLVYIVLCSRVWYSWHTVKCEIQISQRNLIPNGVTILHLTSSRQIASMYGMRGLSSNFGRRFRPTIVSISAWARSWMPGCSTRTMKKVDNIETVFRSHQQKEKCRTAERTYRVGTSFIAPRIWTIFIIWEDVCHSPK